MYSIKIEVQAGKESGVDFSIGQEPMVYKGKNGHLMVVSIVCLSKLCLKRGRHIRVFFTAGYHTDQDTVMWGNWRDTRDNPVYFRRSFLKRLTCLHIVHIETCTLHHSELFINMLMRYISISFGRYKYKLCSFCSIKCYIHCILSFCVNLHSGTRFQILVKYLTAIYFIILYVQKQSNLKNKKN